MILLLPFVDLGLPNISHLAEGAEAEFLLLFFSFFSFVSSRPCFVGQVLLLLIEIIKRCLGSFFAAAAQNHTVEEITYHNHRHSTSTHTTIFLFLSFITDCTRSTIP